jgi:hypothetical protein
MTMLIKDPRLEENLIESRKRTDADRWDEVWEGVYVVSPLPNIEHQEIVSCFDTLASLSGYFIPLGHDAMIGLYRNVLAPGHRGAYR